MHIPLPIPDAKGMASPVLIDGASIETHPEF
jgi:hypothetical protein